MPVDIALHPVGNFIQGEIPPAPVLPLLEGQTGLAEATDSQALNVTSAFGAVLVLVATAKLRVDIRPLADAASLSPAASALVLPTDQRVTFHLPKGDWVLRTAVYA